MGFERRAYVRPVPGISVSEQIIICGQRGVPSTGALYVDSENSFPKQREKLLESLRINGKPDEVLVSDLPVLVRNRKDLKAVRKELRSKKAIIIEGRHNRRSTNAEDFADMIQEAIEFWSRNSRGWTRRQAKEMGAKGGKAAAAGRKRHKAPTGEACAIWHDKSLGTEEAIDKINAMPGYALEWTRTSCYRKFGPRKIPTGPRGARPK